MDELIWESAREVAEKVRSGSLRASDVVDAHLARIEATEPRLQAFLKITAESAREQARAIDAKVAAGTDPGVLAGIPLGLKDNLCTQGIETTAGSQILNGFRPPYSATVAERLQEAGAILLGKLNLDEFGMGSSTENSAYQATRNPWKLSQVPGGSSGGSAAAVSSAQVSLALGSDTGGSIRQPAALCGCVGFKPSYGLVSRYGLLAFASSLDQVGPLTRTCRDAALVMDVLWGSDPRDMTSREPSEGCRANFAGPAPFSRASGQASLLGKTLGVAQEHMELVTDPEVRSLVEATIARAEQAGATIKPVSLKLSKYAIPTYQLVSTAEASSNLARYDGVHYGRRSSSCSDVVGLYERSRAEGFGPEVKRRILLGTTVLASGFYDAYYLKGQRARHRIKEDYLRALDGVDALLGPTSPVTAFGLGERTDPLAMYAVDVFTVSVNLAGLPGLSLPCGWTSERLPVGLQLVGRAWSDPQLLALGCALETALDLEARRPELS